MKKTLIYAVLILFSLIGMANNENKTDYRQNIRGVVLEEATQQPLIGASVVVIGSDPIIGVTTNYTGEFVLTDLPVGRYALRVSFMGFETIDLTNLLLSSGKELVLKIEMQEVVYKTGEFTITASAQKEKPQNTMAKVSARSFTVEETHRYAGSLGDPSRMVANYAGVATANDSRNDIIIRGNSPSGVLWRLEGIDIPNPNHFGALGTTGGPVSMLNSNLLTNSDFFTGAFPAEYGNALAGAFDLRMRSGNNRKYEFTGQIGFNGFELGAEGPFAKNYNGSFLINYRYSTLGLVNKIGLDAGAGSSVPDYQDLSFKIDLPSNKIGRTVIFGLGGKSFIELDDSEKDSTEFSYGLVGTDTEFGSDMGVVGIYNIHFFNPNTRLKTYAAVSGTRNYTFIDSLDLDGVNPPMPFLRSDFIETKYNAGAQLSHKFNTRNYLITGLSWDRYEVNFVDSVWIYDEQDWIDRVNDKGTLNLLQGYVQWQHRFSDNLELVSGIHSQTLTLNNQIIIEPRLALSYELNEKSALNFGAGLHSQIQPHNIYFVQTHLDDGTDILTNEELGATRSMHLVASYDFLPKPGLRVKAETYYQYLFDVPVKESAPEFSMLNAGDFFAIPLVDSLLNEGTGQNYGLEMTLERFFANGYYYLLTASLYQSTFKGYDGIERNTSFNGNYTFNALVGYEFKIGEHNALSLDFRGVYAGGKRYIPIDVDASMLENTTVYDMSKAYESKHSDYFNLCFRIAFRLNGKKVNQEWALDVKNLTNHQNIFTQSWNPLEQEIHTDYQQGFFPMMLWRIQF